MELDTKQVLLSILMELGVIDQSGYEEHLNLTQEDRLFAIVIKEIAKLTK